MDKGIRPVARAKFAELNEKRRKGEEPYTGPKANVLFRREVMSYIIEQFGVTISSAATHYNDAFKLMKSVTPELVHGLGRPEDKKGGRKLKAKSSVAATQLSPAIPEPVEYEQQQTIFKVCKKRDGSVVADGLTFEQARALVDRSAALKKSRLYWV